MTWKLHSIMADWMQRHAGVLWENTAKITEDLAYDIYQMEDSTIIVEMLGRKQEEVEGFEDWAAETNMDRCIRLSDYNKLRGLLGKKPISLSEDE